MTNDQLKQQVLKEYLAYVDFTCEELEWKSHFGPEEIVSKIVDIVLSKIEMNKAHDVLQYREV